MEEKKGVFYGVSVGPGDPELLTVKALRVLERCQVIAAPQTKSGEMLALDIVRQAMPLDGKTILPLFFTMGRDKSKQHAAHLQAAELVERHLLAGRDVAMLNLGDVSIYATWGYLMELLQAKGYETVMIPGVPSFCAAAARVGMSLASGDTPLHIIPAGGHLEAQLAWPGAKALMKAGQRLSQTVETIRKHGGRAVLVRDCGLPTEAVYPDLEQLSETAGYFATILIKEP